MIQEAIEQLNKKGGSSKEHISTFIKENYNYLPCAHNGMLKHHLNLLSKSGYLVLTDDRHYLISNRAIERSDDPSRSPSVGTNYNSISSSRLRTKSSIRRLGRSSQKAELFVSSEVDSATKYGLMSQGEKENELKEGSAELQEHENQKKRGRKSCDKSMLNGKRKKTATMQTRVAGRGRGRPPKKVVLEISEEENCPTMTDDKSGDIPAPDHEYRTEEMVNRQNITDASPDEVIEKKKKNHVDYLNEAIGEQTNLLYLLQDSANGEFLPDQEDKEEEANMRIEVLDRHEAITKVPKKRRGRPSKTEKIFQLKPQGKNDALKISTLQNPNEERDKRGTSSRKSEFGSLGRRLDAPPKNDKSRQLQMIQKRI